MNLVCLVGTREQETGGRVGEGAIRGEYVYRIRVKISERRRIPVTEK